MEASLVEDEDSVDDVDSEEDSDSELEAEAEEDSGSTDGDEDSVTGGGCVVEEVAEIHL